MPTYTVRPKKNGSPQSNTRPCATNEYWAARLANTKLPLFTNERMLATSKPTSRKKEESSLITALRLSVDVGQKNIESLQRGMVVTLKYSALEPLSMKAKLYV